MHKLLHYLLFAAAVGLSSLQLSLIIAPTVSALTNINDMSATKQMQSYQYYHAMMSCLEGDKNNIQATLINAVDAKKEVAVGHLISADNGKHQCQTVVTKAVNFWGIGGSEKDILKSWGFKDSTNGLVSNSSPRSGFGSYIRSQVFNNQEPVLTSAMRYNLYYGSLVNACGAGLAADDASGDSYVSTKIVEGDPPDSKAVAKKMKVSDKTRVITMGLGNMEKELQCITLASKMGEVAGAYAEWANENPDLAGSDYAFSDAAGSNPEEESPCQIEGLGWVICPAMTFMGDITDAVYGRLITFLTIPNLGEGSGGAQLKSSHGYVLSLANLLFVIAFIVIIYSQITSIGITNYGIKKMLPRIVITAILVNLSYWITIGAVELSNVVGQSVYEIIGNANSSMFSSVDNNASGVFDGGSTTANSWGGIIAAALALGGSMMFVQLSILFPALISVLAIVMFVVVALTLRQGLVILLIIISPLAFVSFLLPNTEKFFKLWWSTFKIMLLMFPIISFVFAASSIASSIIMQVADGETSTGLTLQIIGAAVSLIPLVVVPTLITRTGGVIGKFMGNNPSKGLIDRAKKNATERGAVRDNQRAAAGFRQKTPFRRRLLGGSPAGKQKLEDRKNASEQLRKRSQAAYTAERVTENDGDNAYAKSMAFGGGDAGRSVVMANAISSKAELQASEVKAQKAIIEELNLSEEQKADLGVGGSVVSSNGAKLSGADNVALRMAARESVVEGGDSGQLNRLVDHLDTKDAEGNHVTSAATDDGARELSGFANSLMRSSNKPAYMQPATLQNLAQQGNSRPKLDKDGNRLKDKDGKDIMETIQVGNSDNVIDQALKDNVYSSAKIASTGRQELGIVNKRVEQIATVDVKSTLVQQIAVNAKNAIEDERLAPSLSKQLEVAQDLASRAVPQSQQKSQSDQQPKPPRETTSHQGKSFDQSDGGLYVPRGR